MIHDLKPYPTMKESGVPWLGEVPEHWDVRRLKWAVLLNPSKTEIRLSLMADTPVTFLPMERVGADGRIDASDVLPASAVWNGFTYFRRGDVLVAKITPCFENGKGACLDRLPTIVGFGSTEFHVLRASTSILPQFLYRLTIVSNFRRLGADAMTGAAGQQRVPQSFVANFPITLPPLPEQASIVRFLDHAERQIGRYIRSKQKLIKLLEEQKQAIIHRAVTRGLDPNVRLKPSGVEWLGDMPEHWRVSRIKSLAQTGTKTFTDGDWIELPYITDHGVRLIQTGNVGRGEYREKGFRFVSEDTFRELRCTEVRPGDILICRLDGPVGRACLGPDLGGKAITSVDNTILKVRSDIDSRYVVYVLSSLEWLDWIQSICRAGGGFRYRVSRSMLGDARLPRPLYTEQRAIADHLDTCLLSIRRVADCENAAITRLREYRARLIGDVVTGKVDVREAASRLSDEAEEEEQVEEEADGEGESENADLVAALEEVGNAD